MMENQNLMTSCNKNFPLDDITFIKNLLHRVIYTNYNYVMELASEIVKCSDILSFNTYNPVSRAIEFKIKKSFCSSPEVTDHNSYYRSICPVLKRMINTTWNDTLIKTIHDDCGGVQDPEYKERLAQFNKICNEQETFFMLLVLITITTSSGILLYL